MQMTQSVGGARVSNWKGLPSTAWYGLTPDRAPWGNRTGTVSKPHIQTFHNDAVLGCVDHTFVRFVRLPLVKVKHL